MAKRHFALMFLFLSVLTFSAVWVAGQESHSGDTVFRVTTNLVQLDVAVTDSKGNYITGLLPSEFAILEDGIPQATATFEEGNGATQNLLADTASGDPINVKAIAPQGVPSAQRFLPVALPDPPSSPTTGASVFILFDTSNYMYRGFVFAQDAIAEFVRSLDHPDRVAFYSYSRDFSRPAALTPDRTQVLRGVRATVAGDDAALYDALLLTLKDAAKLTGRKVVVAFSNGPDNASMVSPEDVRELAQSEGIPVYMISTREAKLEPLSTAVFERMTASTGGKAYFAKDWQDQQKAFASIRDDLAHLYSLSYYPRSNPNRGWRTITVKLVGDKVKGYRIRARSGYRPKAIQVTQQMTQVQ